MPSAPSRSTPLLMPCLMLSHGRVMLPGEGGPKLARGPDGSPLDVFDVSERLVGEFGRLYVVDLDGIDRDRPELDFLQELSRDAEVWVDAGVRTADQAIDVLVTGAHRAVLSTGTIASDRSVGRAWKLSTDIAVEIEVRDGSVAAAVEAWRGGTVEDVSRKIRDLGPAELILSFREEPVDWNAVRGVAAGGPVWVDGTFERRQSERLGSSGAAGGIFHVTELLDSLPIAEQSSSTRSPRNDESRTS